MTLGNDNGTDGQASKQASKFIRQKQYYDNITKYKQYNTLAGYQKEILPSSSDRQTDGQSATHWRDIPVREFANYTSRSRAPS